MENFYLEKRIAKSSRIFKIIFCSFFLVFYTSCKKLVDTNVPTTNLSSDNVYNNDATAAAVITGIYAKLSGYSFNSPGLLPSLSFISGLSSDEFTIGNWITQSTTQAAYYQNNLSSSVGGEVWSSTYPLIFICNSAIEGLSVSKGVTPAVQQHLIGEAKFLRSFFYFYLVNLYGDVPLALSTDYKVTSVLRRSSKTTVYQQITNDLQDAVKLLPDTYVKADAITSYPVGSAERVRPNKYAALSLLARVSLFAGNYATADSAASVVINNSVYYNLSILNNVFLKNNQEAIWQLQPINSLGNVLDAGVFNFNVPTIGTSSSHPVYLSSALLNSFEVNDQRKANGNWITTYTAGAVNYAYLSKYKIYTPSVPPGQTSVTPTEYCMLLRLGEQYLIRAEARAMQSNLQGAINDINFIRLKHGGLTTALPLPVDQTAAINAIVHERQVELFGELGDRWLTLKRVGQIDAVMSTQTPIKANGAQWQSYQQLYPIPVVDLGRDPNLIQNAGY